MGFRNTINDNSWPEASSEPSIGNASVGGGSQSQGAPFSIQANAQIETIQKMEVYLRSNKDDMDRIESLIVSQDKKLDLIRDDIDKVRKVVLATDKRTMRLLAPPMEKTYDQIRRGNTQVIQKVAECNRTVRRVENSAAEIKAQLQSREVQKNTTTTTTAFTSTLNVVSNQVKNGMQAVLTAARELKTAMQTVTKESRNTKNELHAVATETRDLKNGMQAVANESHAIMNGVEAALNETRAAKSANEAMMMDTKEIKQDMHSMADEYVEIKQAINSFVYETKSLAAAQGGVQATTHSIMSGIERLNNPLESAVNACEEIKRKSNEFKAEMEMQLEKMNKNRLHLASPKPGKEDSWERTIPCSYNSADHGLITQCGYSELPVSDNDSLFSPETAAEIAAAQVDEIIEGVAPVIDGAASIDVMVDGFLAPPSASPVTPGGFTVALKPGAGDVAGSFTQNVKQNTRSRRAILVGNLN